MRGLDGSAGGGQLVRTAVALAAVTGEPFVMEHVRGGRDPAGLRPQHVAAIETVAALANAKTEGVAVGAKRFTFEPGRLADGTVERDVGTAGSVTLVFDALLPLATRLESPATVRIVGGTDVKWSPPFDYFRAVKLPILRRSGLDAAVDLHRRGFYPSGGGAARLTLDPSAMAPLDLERRGALESLWVHSVASESLRDASVAGRQAEAAVAGLADRESVPIERSVDYVDAADPGSAVVIVATYANSIAGFGALGERGKPSESVAATAIEEYDAFRATDAAVDDHFADQSIPFLALVGGAVRIPRVTAHVETAVDLVGEFELDVEIERTDGDEAILRAEGTDEFGGGQAGA